MGPAYASNILWYLLPVLWKHNFEGVCNKSPEILNTIGIKCCNFFFFFLLYKKNNEPVGTFFPELPLVSYNQHTHLIYYGIYYLCFGSIILRVYGTCTRNSEHNRHQVLYYFFFFFFIYKIVIPPGIFLQFCLLFLITSIRI